MSYCNCADRFMRGVNHGAICILGNLVALAMHSAFFGAMHRKCTWMMQ